MNVFLKVALDTYKMESFDALIIARIVEYMGGPYFAVPLRATCRAMRELIAPPEKCETHVMLCRGAREGRRDLCELAHSPLLCEEIRGTWNYTGMMREAARFGYASICKLAREWAAQDASAAFDGKIRADIRAHHEHLHARALRSGEYFEMRTIVGMCNPEKMMRNAGRSGSREMCKLALDWAGMEGSAVSQTYNMIRGAAERGDREFLDWVLGQSREKERRIYAYVLIGAARGGHRDICEDALREVQALPVLHFMGSCCATRKKHYEHCIFHYAYYAIDDLYNDALYEAARGGRLDICNFLISREINHMCFMLMGAARGGHRALCDIAIALRACNFDDMLSEAARGGHRELCEYAIQLGARGFNRMFLAAARGGHIDICEWARSIGARDFTGVASIAHKRAFVKLCKLSHKWRVSSGDV